jgi:hypothetical protein
MTPLQAVFCAMLAFVCGTIFGCWANDIDDGDGND